MENELSSPTAPPLGTHQKIDMLKTRLDGLVARTRAIELRTEELRDIKATQSIPYTQGNYGEALALIQLCVEHSTIAIYSGIRLMRQTLALHRQAPVPITDTLSMILDLELRVARIELEASAFLRLVSKESIRKELTDLHLGRLQS